MRIKTDDQILKEIENYTFPVLSAWIDLIEECHYLDVQPSLDALATVLHLPLPSCDYMFSDVDRWIELVRAKNAQ